MSSMAEIACQAVEPRLRRGRRAARLAWHMRTYIGRGPEQLKIKCLTGGCGNQLLPGVRQQLVAGVCKSLESSFQKMERLPCRGCGNMVPDFGNDFPVGGMGMAPKELGTPVSSGPRTWVQTERAAHEAWGNLTMKSPRAAALMHQLVANMGHQNAVVVSAEDPREADAVQ